MCFLNRISVKNALLPGFVFLIYAIVVTMSLDNCYFWDNIQQTSREAHWLLDNGFSSFFKIQQEPGSEIVRTGYHFPLTGIITALLWKVFGYRLAVSHIFTGLCALLLLYHTIRLVQSLLPLEIAIPAAAVMLLDSTILAQIAIASPDIILLTCFVIAIRAVLDGRRLTLAVSMIFLVFVSGRGLISGIAVFISAIIYRLVTEKKIHDLKSLAGYILPFLPAFFCAILYYGFVFIANNGILPDKTSPWGEGWVPPSGAGQVLKNLAAFSLRLAENGRIFIWLAVLILIGKIGKNRVFQMLKDRTNFIIVTAFLCLLTVFLVFALSTKLVMASRYYMGLTMMLTLLLFRLASGIIPAVAIRTMSMVLIVILLTGNLWIYPEKIARAWDGTLGHLSYYPVREECFRWLERENYDFSLISSGFCLCGNQRYIDLKDRDLYISDSRDNRFFLYSNVSNIEDEFIDELRNNERWKMVREFKRGFIFIVLYENNTAQ